MRHTTGIYILTCIGVKKKLIENRECESLALKELCSEQHKTVFFLHLIIRGYPTRFYQQANGVIRQGYEAPT